MLLFADMTINKKLVKNFIHLILFAAAAYTSLKMTTYGWVFWSGEYVPAAGRNMAMPAKLKAHVAKLAGEIGSRDVYKNNFANLGKAQAYIAAQLKSYGYKVEYQAYPVAGTKAVNLTATRTGTSLPDETIVVGAHYDTFNNPGADDNASGVAGMLALAELAAKRQLARTMKFVAFANEEPPFFRTKDMGSAVWSKTALERKENIKAAVVLEMIGYYKTGPESQKYPPFIGPFHPNKGNFITQVSDFRSRAFARRVDAEFRKNSGLPLVTVALPSFVPGVDFSDHRNFWKDGYQAVMFTDTSFYRNANYHKQTDTPETLDYERMAAVIEGLAPALFAEAGAAK